MSASAVMMSEPDQAVLPIREDSAVFSQDDEAETAKTKTVETQEDRRSERRREPEANGWKAGFAETSVVIAIGNHCRDRGLGWVLCRTGFQPIAERRDWMLRPDAAFVRRDRVTPESLARENFLIAPDLAAEVLAPSDSAEAVDYRLNIYDQSGVSLVWLIDPEARCARVHRQDGSISLLRDGDELNGEAILPGLRYPVSALFAGPAEPTAIGPHSAEDLLRHPQEQDFELVNGYLVEKKPMSLGSDLVKSRLAIELGLYCRARKLTSPICDSKFELIAGRRDTVRGPDIAVVRRGLFPKSGHEIEGYPHIPLDLAVEVISPHDLAVDVDRKLDLYLQAGIPLIWTVYPQTRTIQVIRQNREGFRLEREMILDGETVLPGFHCPIQTLFQDEEGSDAAQ